MSYCPGPPLTQQQVEQYAYNAGFRGNALATVVAISYRETGGTFNPSCVNTQPVYTGSTPNYATGILQFLQPLHPVNALDPQSSFDYAFQLYQQQGFSAWTCDVECGYPPGLGITPVSPQTVIGQNGQPVQLNVNPTIGPPSFGPVPNPIHGVNPPTPGDVVGGLTSAGLSAGIANGLSAFTNGLLQLKNVVVFDLESLGIFILGGTIISVGILVLASPNIQSKIENQIPSQLESVSATSGGTPKESYPIEGGLAEDAAVAA